MWQTTGKQMQSTLVPHHHHHRTRLLGSPLSSPPLAPPSHPTGLKRCTSTTSRAHEQQRAAELTARASVRSAAATGSASAASCSDGEVEVWPQHAPGPRVVQGWWTWNGYKIRYQRSGDAGEAIVLVHGFGGNADHWRQSTGKLAAKGYRVFAIDLLGYGFSDKPDPTKAPINSIYCFPNWGKQLSAFITEVVGSPAYIISNSVGGLSGLECAIARPDQVKGVQLQNISLRGLHQKRMPSWQRPLVAAFQRLLRESSLGGLFFSSIAQPQAVRRVLEQAYAQPGSVSDELVDAILTPGLQPGALAVFLDFISYSSGPLPEELLAQVKVPVSILWGEKDPWEDIKLGRELFADLPSVCEFIPLPGLGHCPHDQAPDVVNEYIAAFCARTSGAASAP